VVVPSTDVRELLVVERVPSKGVVLEEWITGVHAGKIAVVGERHL
jgi:hypothetical protein